MDKQLFLKQLDMGALREKWEAARERVADAKKQVDTLESELRAATEAMDLHEADITCSEGYKQSGSNAEIRKAYLVQQRRDNFEFRKSIAVKIELDDKVAAAKRELDAAIREESFRKNQYKGGVAILNFMGD
jgi:hypothetical protein